jgi:hypothetical protein
MSYRSMGSPESVASVQEITIVYINERVVTGVMTSGTSDVRIVTVSEYSPYPYTFFALTLNR